MRAGFIGQQPVISVCRVRRPLREKRAAAAERLRKFSKLAIEHLPAETLDILTFHAAAYLDRALDTRRFMDEFHTLRNREGAARKRRSSTQ